MIKTMNANPATKLTTAPKTAHPDGAEISKVAAKRKKAHFRARASQAVNVAVAGTFNSWQPFPLQRVGDGFWEMDLNLEPGPYEYRFFIDGLWVNDTDNP